MFYKSEIDNANMSNEKKVNPFHLKHKVVK